MYIIFVQRVYNFSETIFVAIKVVETAQSLSESYNFHQSFEEQIFLHTACNLSQVLLIKSTQSQAIIALFL